MMSGERGGRLSQYLGESRVTQRSLKILSRRTLFPPDTDELDFEWRRGERKWCPSFLFSSYLKKQGTCRYLFLGGTETKHRDELPKAAVVVIQVCGTEQESGCPVRVVSPGSFRFLCIYPYISQGPGKCLSIMIQLMCFKRFGYSPTSHLPLSPTFPWHEKSTYSDNKLKDGISLGKPSSLGTKQTILGIVTSL